MLGYNCESMTLLPVGSYLLKRLLNYFILLVVAINLSWLLAATQLNPRSLYEVANPPIDPISIENNLRSRNLSDQIPLGERWLARLQQVKIGMS